MAARFVRVRLCHHPGEQLQMNNHVCLIYLISAVARQFFIFFSFFQSSATVQLKKGYQYRSTTRKLRDGSAHESRKT
ncbi:hypothetical protein BDW66DRAFT_1836 [Aspergillus desertorum]